MGIVAKNLKTKSAAKTEESQPVVKEKKETPNPFQEAINKKQQFYFDPNKTYLVVNGKPKEVSNKSKYMLDMLIIEEEN